MENVPRRGSANSMSMRSKSAKLLSFMLSSPAAESSMFSPRSSIGYISNCGSTTNFGSSLNLTNDMYTHSQQRRSATSSQPSDLKIAELIASLNFVKENLQQEQERRKILDLELKSIQKECEVSKSRKSLTKSHFKKMADIIDSIKRSKDTELCYENQQLNTQLESLETLFACTIEELSPDLLQELELQGNAEPKPKNLRQSSTVSYRLPSASASNSSISNRRSYRLSCSELGNSLCQENFSNDNEFKINVPDDASIGSVCKPTNSQCQESRQGCTTVPNPNNTAKHSSHVNEESMFCYIDESTETTVPSMRPMSMAQVNRHSAIIGDNLFSLRFQYLQHNNGLENIQIIDEEENVAPPFGCGGSSRSSSERATSDINLLTPSSEKSRELLDDYLTAKYDQPSAVSAPITNVKTSAIPSEDSPTMSCQVGQSSNWPPKMNRSYVKRKFVSNKIILGRSSVTAYQG